MSWAMERISSFVEQWVSQLSQKHSIPLTNSSEGTTTFIPTSVVAEPTIKVCFSSNLLGLKTLYQVRILLSNCLPNKQIINNFLALALFKSPTNTKLEEKLWAFNQTVRYVDLQ